MHWINLRIAVNQDADAISDALMELGAISSSIEDALAETPEEQAIFGEPGDPPPGIWQQSSVSALFAPESDLPEIIQALQEAFALPASAFSQEQIAEQDWVRTTQSQFDPIRIRDDFWIVPSWHTAPSPNGINLVLDPGLAFGTGSHPTTHLCLDWLAQQTLAHKIVLDYGCGSGILAIAAMKLGAQAAIGIDIDAQAIQASQDNARQNAVQADFRLASDASDNTSCADLVVANILSSALNVLAPVLANACRPGGKIALSGILPGQMDALNSLYQSWFVMQAPIQRDGWVLLTGTKKS